MPITITHADLDAKKRKLEEVRAALKCEFFGIDHCIDAIIESIQTWYLLPQVLTRPLVVGLWGLTGTGKTSLVRSLVSHLGYAKHFLEVQMDGFSTSASQQTNTISGLLASSGIEEGKQGVILLDEFQRFRTVNEKGEDFKLERYADVWMLLSDGRFPSNHERLERVLLWMDIEEYWEDSRLYNQAEAEAKGQAPEDQSWQQRLKYKRRFTRDRSDARDIKQMLRRPESIQEIMSWDKDKVRALIEEKLNSQQDDPLDYSRCLVFVSGNLDEAFRMADNVEDCDTSADVFHQHTLKIGVPEIKAALATRFRPEQIARLGNNHVIYPSLSSSAYMSLIKRTCNEYTLQVEKVCGIGFTIDEQVYREVYDNSVYPAQGTRPVFTSIHKLFGSPLSDGVLWALETGVTHLDIALDIPSSSLVFKSGTGKQHVKVDFEIRARRKRASADFNALVAVHEAGHAIVYASLFHKAPIEVAINVASFKGGYTMYRDVILCKEELLNRVATAMGGIVAEETIFGQQLRSVGCEGDVSKATADASRYVRRLAMDGVQGTVLHSMDQSTLEDVEVTDPAVETIVKDQKMLAQTVITQYRDLLVDLSNELVKVRKMTGEEFVSFVGERMPGLSVSKETDVNGDYAARLAKA